jgi:hypothetical protein
MSKLGSEWGGLGRKSRSAPPPHHGTWYCGAGLGGNARPLHVPLTPPPNVSYCWNIPPLLHLEHEQERRSDESRSADHCEPDQLGSDSTQRHMRHATCDTGPSPRNSTGFYKLPLAGEEMREAQPTLRCPVEDIDNGDGSGTVVQARDDAG